MNLFNADNPVMQFLSKLTDLIILNILFILCCIPVVTIGAAATALYTVTLKAARDEESYVVQSFFRAFKNNFKIATPAWLIVLLLGIVFFLDFRFLSTISSTMSQIFLVFLMAAVILYLMLAMYLFPYIARFENTLAATLKNSLLLAIANLPYTLLLLALRALAIAALLFIDFRISGFVWIIAGFSGVAFISSFLFNRIFAKLE